VDMAKRFSESILTRNATIPAQLAANAWLIHHIGLASESGDAYRMQARIRRLIVDRDIWHALLEVRPLLIRNTVANPTGR
jgi:hypothetical protein